MMADNNLESTEKIIEEKQKCSSIEDLLKEYPTMKELLIECANYNLTEYFKQLPMETLEYILSCIERDDILGDKIKIYEAVLTEMEYRDEPSSFDWYYAARQKEIQENEKMYSLRKQKKR